ncbi:MAG: ribosomal-protein-alanine N-acetyltransferase [Gammaproteobacteria bacterium]|nr:MAG: ribosomal-protein-alanine N-acetyltransferase [Gammaproteobacteria bacterium]
MIAADIDAIAAIEQQVTPHPWNRQEFLDSFQKHHCLTLLIYDTEVAGYAVYTLVAGEAEILNIAVAREWQGKGLGRLLLEKLLALLEGKAERLFLEVRADNYPAQRLYQDVGLVEICVRRNYYRTAAGPVDAIIMAMDFVQDC